MLIETMSRVAKNNEPISAQYIIKAYRTNRKKVPQREKEAPLHIVKTFLISGREGRSVYSPPPSHISFI